MPSQQIQFKTHVNPQHAEDAIALLGADHDPTEAVRIDFSQCVFFDPSVGWRLANALRRYAHSGLLEVVLPSRERFGDEQWFKMFTRSGLGYALAFHCDCLVDSIGKDLTTELKEYYERVSEVKGSTHVLLAGIRSRRPFNIDDFGHFNRRFLDLLSKLRMQLAGEEDLQSLATFVFEAIQNVYDHAHSSPLKRGTRVFDYLCVNYHANIRNPPDVAHRLVQYLNGVRRSVDQAQKIIGFMEVIVNDDGVGIAARQSQRADIYWDADTQSERKAVIDALSSGGSIKFAANDCPIRHDPGLGTQKIVGSLQRLRAFAFIRTGRVLAFFDGSDEKQETFEITDEQLGYMPGTGIEVIVPMVDRQLRLGFK